LHVGPYIIARRYRKGLPGNTGHEMGKLTAILDILVEHWKSEIDADIQREEREGTAAEHA